MPSQHKKGGEDAAVLLPLGVIPGDVQQKIFSTMKEVGRMPVGLSSESVSRFAAGILAALWAMAGLANEYDTLAAVGPSLPLIVAIATNVFLLAGASLAFVRAGGWRNVLFIALACVTVDRLLMAAASTTPLQVIDTLIACAAIAGVALLGTRRRPIVK